MEKDDLVLQSIFFPLGTGNNHFFTIKDVEMPFPIDMRGLHPVITPNKKSMNLMGMFLLFKKL